MSLFNTNCKLCEMCTQKEYSTCWHDVEPHSKYDVVVVAESPASIEVNNDKAFSTRGLVDVRKFLESKGIDAYYTYAVKCHKPSKDFKIKPDYAKTCSINYLQKELEIIKPKHIIVLGANALYGATRLRGITKMLGNKHFVEKLDAHVYPTLHHMQGLYDESAHKVMQKDLERFVTWITGDGEAPQLFDPPVMVATTLKSLRRIRKLARMAPWIVCDTETNGLNQYGKDFAVRTIQFCLHPEHGGIFIPLDLEPDCYYEDELDEKGKPKRRKAAFWQDEPLEEAVEIIRDILYENKIVWHNGKFDRIALHEWGARRFGAPLECPHIEADTMHLAHLADENRPVGLKKLITSELDYPSFDIADKLTKNLSLLIPYSSKDTVATAVLYSKFQEDLKEELRLRKLYKHVVKPIDKVFTEMELYGWPVDEKKATKKYNELEQASQNCFEEMQVIARKMAGVEFEDFGSPQKLGNLLFDHMGLPVVERTAGGQYSTSKTAMLHLKGHPLVDKIFEWREINKALSTYAKPMVDLAQTRGRLTTSYKITGTVTGRTASGKESETSRNASTATGMNLQNVPHTFGIKALVAPGEPWGIMEADFSQIELRVAAEVSGDPLLIDTFENDRDLHTFRAMRMLGVDEDEWEDLDEAIKKDARRKAKPVNFGFLYGMQARNFRAYSKLQYDIEFTLEECTAIRDQFYVDHSGLKAYYRKQEEFAKKHGYVESLSGRKRRLDNARIDQYSSSEARRKYAEAIRQAINTPIQGFASDLKLMSLIEIHNTIKPSWGYLVGEVHDSVVMVVREDKAERVGAIVKDIMTYPRLLEKMGIEFNTPIGVDVEYGPSWGELKPLNV